MKNGKRQAGFTLIEVAIILMVLVILAAIMLPTIQNFINRARLVRAREDVGALGAAISQFLVDTGENFFMLKGNGGGNDVVFPPSRGFENRVNLLVGDGDIPELGEGGDSIWLAVVNNKNIDFLERHLVTNNPGGEFENRYRTPVDMIQSGSSNYLIFSRNTSSGFNAEFSWRGAYISAPIEADPWGNRYAVNTLFLMPDSINDVVVLSAGPDEAVSTSFSRDGIFPGHDDIISVISSNSP